MLLLIDVVSAAIIEVLQQELALSEPQSISLIQLNDSFQKRFSASLFDILRDQCQGGSFWYLNLFQIDGVEIDRRSDMSNPYKMMMFTTVAVKETSSSISREALAKSIFELTEAQPNLNQELSTRSSHPLFAKLSHLENADSIPYEDIPIISFPGISLLVLFSIFLFFLFIYRIL